jgi:hypothetical protein
MQDQSGNARQHIDPLGSHEEKKKQQQSDPQKTELKGFIDSREDLEPRLEDGTKAPEKAPEENGVHRARGTED